MDKLKNTASSHYLIGMMSGTSCDAIDVALIHADTYKLIHFLEHPMPHEIRETILRLSASALDEINTMGNLDRALGKAFSEAVLSLLKTHNIPAQHILAIGNHGQTIRHQPQAPVGENPFSLQIGCAATMTEQTGITVVSDFRRRDIAAGGQGAPLVPFAHQQLFHHIDKPIAILNIGGIANITMLNQDGSIQGFDTGPGNMLMDALMLSLSDGRYAYDKHGALGASGKVCESLLQQLMHHPFITATPPKSTGREVFGEDMLEPILAWDGLSDADRMATTTAFTVQSIVAQIPYLHHLPTSWLVCGGGAQNTHLIQSLREALAPASVVCTDDFGIPSAAIEAISFAMLAKQTLLGQSNTLCEVTGAHHTVCGGQITPGNNWSQIISWIQEQQTLNR